MDYWLVAHTHWDREWYRTVHKFRAHLVDLVDHLLDVVERDPGYRFVLDGQSIVLEDYLEFRPSQRERLERACRAGQIGIGPWYVQPDSLLPSGESHVRNLMEGIRVASALGTPSRVAYTPDSFGHPSQFPQIFSGFGQNAFVFWRGAGNEVDTLPPEFLWEAPDGSRILACHLRAGYFNSATLPDDATEAVDRLRQTADTLRSLTRNQGVLLLAGADHLMPEERTGQLTSALSRQMGWNVRRGTLDDFVNGLERPTEVFRGELLGGRAANLLPGVWSSRMHLKLRNRQCEALLEGWAEPWAAFGHALGLPDERPALRLAWRALLQNQAHDSIGGCSIDSVHEHMDTRFDLAAGVAQETTGRVLERLAGLHATRATPKSDSLDIAVFNPSPHPRTDIARFRLDGFPAFSMTSEETDVRLHPLVMANLTACGFKVDGVPARLVPVKHDPLPLVPDQDTWELEFVARDLPAFGYKRLRVEPAGAYPDTVDDGREISAGNVRASAAADGTFTVHFAGRSYAGLGRIEDLGDRGDCYDADPKGRDAVVEAVRFARHKHESGIQTLWSHRTLRMPSHLAADRNDRSAEMVAMEVHLEARVTPGLDRVDLFVHGVNTAQDHRLRLLFPTGHPTTRCLAATTFDVAQRDLTPQDDRRWKHPAPKTFPHQGWVSANGLCVTAPGLPEGEVTPDGTIAITLLRSVGWISRPDLETRPSQAGPSVATPAAQCLGPFEGHLSLLPIADPRAARDAELGLLAVAAGDAPLWPAGESLLGVSSRSLAVTAVKPAEEGEGVILRVLNPTDQPDKLELNGAFGHSEASVRLDESPLKGTSHEVPPHALRTWRLRRR